MLHYNAKGLISKSLIVSLGLFSDAAISACIGESKAPYACSNNIYGITYTWSSHKEHADGADNWPVTWAEDDHQYSAWGDGWGFAESGTKRSFGVSKITGTHDYFAGNDIYHGAGAGCSGLGSLGDNTSICGKSYSILSYKQFLVMWAGPESGASGYEESRFFYSRDKGDSWTQTGNYLTGTDFYHPTYIQYGKNHAGPAGDYVYMYGINVQDTTDLTVHKPGIIYLARQKLSDYFAPILNAPPALQHLYGPDGNGFHLEWYAGKNASGQPIWSTNRYAKKPVFQDSRGVGWNLSASYNAASKRYILMTEHDATFQSKLGVFDAPTPWGPWTTVAYYDKWSDQTGAAGDTGDQGFYWNISNKWSGGNKLAMIFTGTGGDDSFNYVRATMSYKVPVVVAPKSPDITPIITLLLN